MTNLYSYSGALLEESPTYVKRDADDQLFDALKHGKFCYVLESRQTGKSSLRVQIMKRLKKDNIYYFNYDMSKLGKSAKSAEEWYQDQIANCIKNFIQNYEIDLLNKDTKLDEVSSKLKEWWEARSGSNLGKYEDFLEGCLLNNIKGNIVFFIDEIDSAIHLPFSVDDFFGFIRGCHEDRTSKKQYERLTFCLMGVASPNRLIEDGDRTPFNLGTAITLSPFPTDLANGKSFEMMKPLLNGGLEDINILQEILNQTGGQPFLTQKLCDLIVKERKNNSFNTVEEVVNLKVINNWSIQDEPAHLKTIQQRFDENKYKPLAFRSLDLYEKILENQSLNADNSQEEIELKLSGLVLQQENILKPYNPIYTSVFDRNWVKAEKRKIQLFSNELNLWQDEDERQKQLHLLYGKKYEDAKQWLEELKPDSGHDEANDFIVRSGSFWEAIQRAFPEWCDRQLMINSMNDWTSGFDYFNDKILQNAEKDSRYLTVGDSLRTLVEENIEDFKEYDQFQKDRGQFLNQDDSFDLISLFEKITQKEPILFDEKNPQHRKLKDMCFIILDKEHNLRILNKIYEKILDQNWIKEVMAGLRPYTKAFRDWQHSDRQESSYLLQNNDIKLALEWLGKKPTPKLEEGEIEFVMTSLVAEVWAKASPSVQSKAVSLITTFRPSLKGKNNYSDFLLREILQWTRHEPLLLRELLEVVNKTEIFTTNYHNWIEQLVKTQIINNSQDSKLAEHFRLIEQRLTNHQSSESFWLIVKYRQILLQGKIEFDEIREDTKLIELGLVVKLDQQLEIANPIYENIFSQRWTYKKLSECKRIRAINLLKWCPANIPEQNDPVLRSYLDEWINNNATIIEKIVQEAKGEVLDNKFDFIDEIKLLTYDIMGMRTSDTPQISIQHSLNRIFKDDVKKMAQNNDLDSLLNKIVENATEIEAIVILGLKAGMVSGKNSNLESNNSSLYQIVRSETLVSFAKLKTIPDILDNFGEKTNFGKLSYAMFTLEKGVVISHFTKIQGNPFAICFISNSEVDMPGLFLAQCEGKFEKIQEELEKVLR